MLVRLVAPAIHEIPLLVDCRVLEQVVAVSLIIAMEVGQICRDGDAFGIVPRPVTDAVARIDRWLAISCLGAQISSPGPIPCTRCCSEVLADPISPFQAT